MPRGPGLAATTWIFWRAVRGRSASAASSIGSRSWPCRALFCVHVRSAPDLYFEDGPGPKKPIRCKAGLSTPCRRTRAGARSVRPATPRREWRDRPD